MKKQPQKHPRKLVHKPRRKPAQKHEKQPRGFTVVELIVVVIVIAVLATTSVIAYNRVQAQARDQKRKADIANLATELDKYFTRTGDYPLACLPSTIALQYCSNIAANYVSSVDGSAPPVIGTSTDVAAIRAILPGLNSDFGDPKRGTDNPLNIGAPNNLTYLKNTTYYVLSLNSWNLDTSAYFRTEPSYTAYQTCGFSAIGQNYQGVSRPSRPHPYVLGYFSEVQNKWVFYHGPKTDLVNTVRWNYDNKPECVPVTSLGI